MEYKCSDPSLEHNTITTSASRMRRMKRLPTHLHHHHQRRQQRQRTTAKCIIFVYLLRLCVTNDRTKRTAKTKNLKFFSQSLLQELNGNGRQREKKRIKWKEKKRYIISLVNSSSPSSASTKILSENSGELDTKPRQTIIWTCILH